MTKLDVIIPEKDNKVIFVHYQYPLWQNKYIKYTSPDGTVIDFSSKSDPLVDSLKTIETLSGNLSKAALK